jgi:hypothetical protein
MIFEIGDKVKAINLNTYASKFLNQDEFYFISHYDIGLVRVVGCDKYFFPYRFELAKSPSLSLNHLFSEIGSPGLVLESELVVMWDCDNTLVMWNQEVSDINIKDPHSGKGELLAKHE